MNWRFRPTPARQLSAKPTFVGDAADIHTIRLTIAEASDRIGTFAGIA
jgi:hypothetical protein